MLLPFFDSFNGVRYWRWGGRRDAVQTEKAASVEKSLGNALSPQRPVHAVLGSFYHQLTFQFADVLVDIIVLPLRSFEW
jgi:hypothetical protein